MKFISRSLPKLPHPHPHPHPHATLSDTPNIKCVRDRALDHAVEKERNLQPMLSLKSLILSQPSKSLPLPLISQNLSLPTRPIDFTRKYPFIFQEYLPTNITTTPHIKLTPQILDLHQQEQSIYQTQTHIQESADRLIKLLMLSRINKIPLHVIDTLKWDLGLPHNYQNALVPLFPDYFKISKDGSFLELVCWSNELAVSEIEKRTKGMEIVFPMQYSRGFEMDRKFKKWVDEWQKLPYVSPYENGLGLCGKSEECDKWAVGVLHEVLHLFVPKKSEKENVLCVGEVLGVRSRFKRALLQLPGIFYVSSKVRTHTVVLREGYKRDLLIGKEQHPLMVMRSKYIHLMNMVKDGDKSKIAQSGKTKNRKTMKDSKEGEGEVGENESGEEQDGELNSEFEDESDDDDYVDGDETNDEDEGAVNGGTSNMKTKFEAKSPLRNESNRSSRRDPKKSMDKRTPRFSRRADTRGDENFRGKSQERSDDPKKSVDERSPRFSRRTDTRGGENVRGRSQERSVDPKKSMDERSPRFLRRTDTRGGENVRGRSQERSDAPRTKGRGNLNRRAST